MRKFSLSFLENAVNSGYDQGEHCLSPKFFALLHCNLLAHTIFENICLPLFSINSLLFIGKIGLVRKSQNHKTVTNLSDLVFVSSGNHSFKHTKTQLQ